MKRLATKNINTAQEYDRIYFNRQEKGVDDFDLRRWELLLKHYRGGRLCDLGCLDSQVPMMAKQRHSKAEIWGIDQAREALEDMQVQYPKVFWHVGDIYDTKFATGYFRYVVAGEVIEHLEEPERFIKEAMRLLAQGGVLALSTPFNEAIEPGAVDADRHLWSFTEEDIRAMLEPYGTVYVDFIRSQQKPVYKYHFPNIVAWVKKGKSKWIIK